MLHAGEYDVRAISAEDIREHEMFRKYSIALKMWSRRFNTAEIAAHLKGRAHRAAMDMGRAPV